MEIESVFLINRTEPVSGKQGSEDAESPEVSHNSTETDDRRTDEDEFSSASFSEESSGCTYTVAEVALDASRSRGSRLMSSRCEESSIRETPVARISWPKIPLGDVDVGGEPVVKSTTEAFAHAGGRGPTGEFLSRNPDGRRTPACVEEDVGGLQENSYQETLPGDCEMAVTTESEVLECVRGLRECLALERSTSTHVEENRAGDLQENSYQEIPSGKSRADNISTEPITNHACYDEGASDVGVDSEVKIVAVGTYRIKFSMNPEDPNPVSNEKESYERVLTMSDDQVEEESYVNQPQFTPSKKVPMLATPSNPERIFVITSVEYSRDQLLMRKDNIAHFMSVDCEINTSICQQLVDLEMIDIEKLKNEPIGIGTIV